VVVDLILEPGEALRVGACWRSSTMDFPSGSMMRFQMSRTRFCPNATWLSYWPINRDPCGMSRNLPVGVS
jgi:hypothetical protein